MNKSTLLPLLCLAAALPLLWSGCQKDPPCDDPLNPECPNYDRCLTVPKTNAEFIVSDWATPNEIQLPYKDTIPLASSVRVEFRAADRNMSRYEWKIGSDPRVFTDTTFFLIFEDVSGWVNVSLTTYNDKADATCYPGDTGKMTTQKGIYFKQYTPTNDTDWVQQYPVFGTYRGYNEDTPQDTFGIRLWFDFATFSPQLAVMSNFPKDCSYPVTSVRFNTHYINFSSTHCLKPEALGVLQNDNRTLIIDYSLDGPNWTRVNKRWRGVKIE